MIADWQPMTSAQPSNGRSDCLYWANDKYKVEMGDADWCGVPAVRLTISQHDGAKIFRDWRHFQQIKDDIVGPECEAVELYPAESRRTDRSNKYHLLAIPNPSFRFPVVFIEDEHVRREVVGRYLSQGGA